VSVLVTVPLLVLRALLSRYCADSDSLSSGRV
jgi:hypothetical protein